MVNPIAPQIEDIHWQKNLILEAFEYFMVLRGISSTVPVSPPGSTFET